MPWSLERLSWSLERGAPVRAIRRPRRVVAGLESAGDDSDGARAGLALRRVNRVGLLAEGARLRRGGRRLADEQLADPVDDEGDHNKSNDRVDERSVADRDLGCGIAACRALENDLQRCEVDPAQRQSDRRHDDVLDERVDDCPESDPDDHADRERERVGLQQERLEVAPHDGASSPSLHRRPMIRGSDVASDTYALVHAGHQRRIERFGAYVLERPCAACFATSAAPATDVDARFNPEGPPGHRWSGANVPADTWEVALEGLTFQVGLTDSGQVGLFPDQRDQWRWIAERVSAQAGAPATGAATARSLLNLFGHTGGSTLAAVRAGGSVVHVDASKAAIAWARRNAALSGFPEAPV